LLLVGAPMRISVKIGGSFCPGEAKTYSKAQEENDYVEGKCYSEIVGLKTGNKQVDQLNYWLANWSVASQFLC
jgi:hypothetical protein